MERVLIAALRNSEDKTNYQGRGGGDRKND